MKLINFLRNKLREKYLSDDQHRDKGEKNTYLTMMIIPHSQEGEVKNFSLSVWFLKISAIVCVISVLTIGYFVSCYFYIKYIALDTKELQQINMAQAEEIKELKSLTGDMKNKLEALMEIDREVRTKVGLIEPEEVDVLAELQNNSDLDSYSLLTLGLANRRFASRSSQSDIHIKSLQSLNMPGTAIRQTSVKEKLVPTEKINSLDELKEELEKMDRLLTEQAETMDKLKYDVEKQLAIEQAIPEAWPIEGYITSKFGWRANPFDHNVQEFHAGLDIDGSYGAPICAAGSGVVTFADYQGAWGNVVLISHGFGYVSKYAHNASLLVKKGDKVERGQIVARLGSTGRATGAHLHFGIAYNSEWIDPQTVLK